MKKVSILVIVFLLSSISIFACDDCKKYKNDDFKIEKVSVFHNTSIASTIWEITVSGNAGKTTPTPVGQMNGAPVLGYVFPTTLKPTDVGFNQTDGIVALALTSHPDFDDTPLWDENSDTNYANDGVIWHPHWVILTKDDRVGGGLSVKEFDKDDKKVILPPTNPGMPMYMDSPGFQVITNKNTIKVIVPDYRMNNNTDFSYDGVTCYMEVNTEKKDKPLLGVYEVFGVASGDLSLPYQVKEY
jgi:hypothetical protein